MLPFGFSVRAPLALNLIALSILAWVMPVNALGQHWWETLSSRDVNFYDVQQQAQAYFDSAGIGKGTGWKAYSRWEYYWQDRVDAQGHFPDPAFKLEEIHRYKERNQGRRTTSTSGNWTNLGPATLPANGTGQPNGLGRVNCIAFHPGDSNIIYAGAPSGGIWRSTDGGNSWTGLNNVNFRFGISSIVIHPQNPDTIYVGTGDRDAGDAPGYGVYWSTDGGVTWSVRNTGMGNRTVNEILIDPDHPDTLIAATASNIYRSTDAGASWLAGLSGHNCKDIAFHPYNRSIIYAAGTKFYRSTNYGMSFTQITSGVPSSVQRMALATTPADSHYVYILAGDGNGFVGLYRSTNSGQSFSTRSTSPNILGYDVTGGSGSQAWYDLVLAADPITSGMLYAGGINIWKSTNGGQNWTIVAHWYGASGTPEIHADQHALGYSPHTNHLYSGNDGGVYFTNDQGASWTDISSGLDIAQVYKIGQSASKKDLVINGYQDNGTAFYQDGGWYTEIGGDGMECIVDPVNTDVMYGALYYGDIRRSTNGGSSFTQIASSVNGVTESGAWVTPYKLHPSYPDTMFAGFENVWRSYNCKSQPIASNVSWTKITSHSNTTKIRDVAISAADDNLMFYARGNDLYRSSNALAGNPSWTDLTGGLPLIGVVRDIELHPRDTNQLWISMGGNIYISDDQGSSWTDYSGTLPNITLNSIVFDTSSPHEGMYVGMDEGIYYRDTTMSDWISFSTGLPSVEITELEIYYDTECGGESIIRASTYGRGLWESTLCDPGNLPPQSCFTIASDEVVCSGQSMQLTDQSDFSPTGWSWSIAPNTFTYANGYSANSQHPMVLFHQSDTYTITLTASNANGSDDQTNTFSIDVTPLLTVFPAYENFETEELCSETSNCGLTTCPLSNSIWENGTTDDIDWRVDNGGTPSSGTGPGEDFDPGTGTGKYIYLEASGCFAAVAHLLCHCIDLTGYTEASLSLPFHMEGSTMGDLYVDVYSNGTWYEKVGAVNGNQGDSWNLLEVDLSPFLDDTIHLRIRGVTGGNEQSDIALDGLQIDASATILPIADLLFAGKSLGNGNHELTWTGLDYSDDKHAEVQRNENGTFKSISETIPVIPRGSDYTFTDVKPFPQPHNYYRLKVTRHDGSVYYSNIVSLSAQIDQNALTIVPNPFSNLLQVTVRGSGTEARLSIIDQFGRTRKAQIVELHQGEGTFQWSLEDLPPGFYIIQWGAKQQKVIKIR